MYKGYIDNSIRCLFKITQKQLLGIIAVEALFAILAMFLPWYVPFLMILFAFIILMLLKWPEYSLIPIALFYTLHNVRVSLITEERIMDFALPLDVFVIFSVIAIILGKVVRKLPSFKSSSIAIPLIAFVGFALISNLWSSNHYYSILFSLKILSCVLVFYCSAVLANNRKTVEILCWVFLVAGIILTAAGYYSTATSEIYHEKKISIDFLNLGFSYSFLKSPHSQRASGFSPPNTVSFCINVAIFFGLALIFTVKSRIKKYLLGCILITLLIGDVLTFSKGGLLSLIFVVSSYIMLLPQLKGKRVITWLFYFAVFVAAVFFVIIIIQGGDPGKFAKDPTSVKGKSSLGIRLWLWERGFDQLSESYGLGTGIGGMMDHIGKGSNLQSSYFSILFDFGLVGVLLFSWLAFAYAQEIYKAIKESKDEYYKTLLLSLACIMLTYAIHTIIEFEVFFRVPWFIAGMILGIVQLLRREQVAVKE